VVFFSGSESAYFFLLFVYICIVVGDPICRGGLEFLAQSHCCFCMKAVLGFAMPFVVIYLCSIVRDKRCYFFRLFDISGKLDLTV